ncbi:recombinase family protein [Methylorubrum extorquens]|uniref:Resolvase domain protein n=1 Tax=Methylorubrum extorquens DSM 13060 TaxID=882800 RepID=H1KI20_METEX|nr:recombinase family protein [Methylorubrum extorquens]EHP92852.1 Resolvase domain protein [Methylorubrum extorquens DSM 13060]
MAEGKFVTYLRVSTKRQGDSGLGLDAQRKAVSDYLNGGAWAVCGEFVEIESGKSDVNRPQLQRAIAACRIYGAKLLIAKFDRLSRDAHFLLGLEKAGIEFVATDNPHANRLTVGIMALVADEERRAISARTKAALAAAKARGVKLGGNRGAILTIEAKAKGVQVRIAKANNRATDLMPVIADIRAAGAKSLRHVADALNERGIPTAKGGRWSATQVSRVEARVD